ncbi:hypothetical protein [Sphingobacterium anhuiense]|uniref:hypothetical protein n=1 Tax=Sphingobacterium anhuiense TaxID=493780 RepID=UPI003C2BE22E
MKDKILIQELEKYLTFLKKISQDDLEALQKKKMEIVFEIREKQRFVKSKEFLFTDEEIDNIIEKLGSIEKREDGIIYLNGLNLGRLDVERILKKLDLPTMKKDTIQQLFDKIIENTIGYKLRSKAIQNNTHNSQ